MPPVMSLYHIVNSCDTELGPIHPLHPEEVNREKLEAACRKAQHETSTVADYLPFAKFYQNYPFLRPYLPEFMKKVPLILECRVKCSCTIRSCKKSHRRIWKSNIEELKACGLLSLVSELRVLLYNDSPKDLHLDEAIQELGIPRGAIATTKLIKFLGHGLFLAGDDQSQEDAKKEAARTIQIILGHCPHVEELWYHPDRVWRSSRELLRDQPGVGTEIMMTLRSVLHSRLTMMQVARPFAAYTAQPFSPNLRYLALDLKLVPELGHLPPIPTDNMSHLELTKISNGINWDLFKTGADGRVHFPNLKTLVLCFKEPEKGLIQSSLDMSKVVIPATVGVIVFGINNGKRAVWEYFKKGCRQLTLFECPSAFKDIDVYNLQCSEDFQLRLTPEEGDSSKPLPFAGLRHFFGHRNYVIRKMEVTGIELMVPPTVNLHIVEDLHLSLGIADSNTILNLAHRLTRLRILRIRCFSMYRKDLNNPGRGVHFANEAHELDIIAEYASGTPVKASKNLHCLHLYSRMAIDPNRFIDLMARFPNLAEIQVNGEIAEYVGWIFRSRNVITSAIDPSTV